MAASDSPSSWLNDRLAARPASRKRGGAPGVDATEIVSIFNFSHCATASHTAARMRRRASARGSTAAMPITSTPSPDQSTVESIICDQLRKGAAGQPAQLLPAGMCSPFITRVNGPRRALSPTLALYSTELRGPM
ncbi:hypothetical protein D3C85_411950 [compost metagenome]